MGNVDLHEQARGEFRRILSGVTDDQLSSATPCTDWDVRALIGHVINGNYQFAAISRGEQPEYPSGTYDVVATYDASAKEAEAAFGADGVTERIFDLPFGQIPGEIAIGIHATDIVTHSWDLAKATGQKADLPDDLVAPLLQLARMFPDSPELRGPGGPFAPRVECSDGAPLLEQLVAQLGRQP
ncbi:MAG TPA: TIGR03086 family metal-binding protein [Acidimicrobiales bacterium]